MSNAAMLLKRAQDAHGAGNLRAAMRLYEQVLGQEPRNYRANYLMGIALYQAGELARSVRLLETSAQIRPEVADPARDLGIILLKLRNPAAAEAWLARALRLEPRNPQLLVNRGIALKNLGRSAEAAASHRAALAAMPDFAEAHHHLGNALLALGQPEEALASFRRAIARKPGFAEAFQGQGQALLDLGRGTEALAVLREAVRLVPQSADAHRALGTALLRQGDGDAALQSIGQALALAPGNPDALTAQGAAHESKSDFTAALASYEAAVAADPRHVDALLGLAGGLRRLSRFDEAIARYDQAIALAPVRAEGYHGVGLTFFKKREFAAAARSFDAAIKHQPDTAAFHYMRAQALYELRQPAPCLAALDRAITLDPAKLDPYLTKAQVLSELRDPEAAIAVLEEARRLEGGELRTAGPRFAERMQICDWSEHAADLPGIAARVAAGEDALNPFLALTYLTAPALHLACAERHAKDILRDALPPEAPALSLRDGRITIGYFSGDFRDHAMMYLMAELFELHDRSRFRIHAYSFARDEGSAMRHRVKPLFDAFHDLDELNDREVLDLARADGVDIAVDLVGHTRHSRSSLFATGLAPLQVNYLGYPGTMGHARMDYIVADPLVIPEAMRIHYSEKLACLPDAYQPNDRKRAIAATPPSRAEHGLPEEAFVYCCFNNNSKITPDVFASWMNILRQAPDSVLWLFSYNEAANRNLRRAAADQGVAPERLVFAKPIDTAEHLARTRLADLFLDTAPYNAHTTASDALWAGLPLLTLPGDSFASRVAASLLTAAGLPELIAASREDYERMALGFHGDRARLAALRARLAAGRDNCALFDTPRYTRNLESLFSQMVARHQQGLAPDHLSA